MFACHDPMPLGHVYAGSYERHVWTALFTGALGSDVRLEES